LIAGPGRALLNPKNPARCSLFLGTPPGLSAPRALCGSVVNPGAVVRAASAAHSADRALAASGERRTGTPRRER